MKNKKVLLGSIIAVALAITGATLWSTGVVKAGNGAGGQNMAANLAEKLKIDESQVSSAMEQIRSENRAQRQVEVSGKLDEAVSDGVITAEQKEKLLTRQTEVQQKREQERQDCQKWQEESGIDMSKLRDYGIGGLGFGGGKGNGGPRGPMTD